MGLGKSGFEANPQAHINLISPLNSPDDSSYPNLSSLSPIFPFLVAFLSLVPSITPFPHKAVFHRSPCSLE